MKAAKQNLLEQTHQTILKVGFEDNDYKHIEDLIAPNLVGFGTALDETVFGINDLKDLLKRQKDQIEETQVTWKVHKLYTHLSKDENTAVYIDEIVFTITTDSEPMEMIVRFSLVLEYIKDKWLMVHFHSSKPEHVESKKDTWGIETWKQRAQELEKEVAQRTAELEENNKQLALEAALERVRTITMSMTTSNDLIKVVTKVNDEINNLGIEVDYTHIYTNFTKEPKDGLDIWIAAENRKYLQKFHIPFVDHPISITIYKALNRNVKFLAENFKGKEVKEIMNLMVTQTDLKYLPEDRKQMLQNVTSWTRGTVPLSNSMLQVGRFNDNVYSKEEGEILIKFGKVIQQSYTRFLDLQKAEAQAMEAQLETAVERVRSRTISMTASEELGEVCEMVLNQMNNLGLSSSHLSLVTDYTDFKSGYNIWLGRTKPSGEVTLVKTFMPYFEHPIWERGIEAIKNGINFYTDAYGKKEKNIYIRKFFKHSKFELPPGRKEEILSYKHWHRSTALSKHVTLQIGRYDGIAFTDHENEILLRFTKVLNQTYTRFLDLQKAEEQAREAQIEASLERVRSASMAMQKSDELEKVVEITFQQLQSLRLPLDGCQLITFEGQTKDLHFWSATPDMIYPTRLNIPFFDHPIFINFWEARDRGDTFMSFNLSRQETLDFYNHLYDKTNLGIAVTKDRWGKIQSIENGFKTSWAIQKNTGIWVFNFSNHQFTEDENSLIDRFAKVFEQTYTRFLDLQKVEEQAREAQIEAALEKVRSSSLAMHKSDELQIVINKVYNTILDLGINVSSVNFDIFNGSGRDFYGWIAADTNTYSSSIYFPAIEYGPSKAFMDARENGDDFVAYQSDKEEMARWMDFAFEHTDLRNISNDRKELIKSADCWTTSVAINHYSAIQLNRYSNELFSDKENDILKRFGKVFEQAYTRFLDLQKAENQAKEAQIEVALERIRSQVAAMNASSDLFNIVVSMRKEFISLGHDADYFWHMQWLKDSYEMSMTSDDGSRVGMVITIPKFVHDNIEALATWEKGNDPICILALNAEEAWDYIHQMNTHGHYHKADPNAPTEEDIHQIGGITFIIARTTHGEIGYSLPGVVENPPKPALNILLRFAAAFDLAYKRFEDLKRSEEQARETQIELALEKVRSRTMAMERSDELQETSFLLDQQVRGLGIETWGCAFHIYGDNESTEWFGNEKGILPTYTVPRTGIFKEYFEKGKKGEALYIKEFSGKACLEHYQFMSTLPVIGDVLKQLKKTNKGFPTYQIDHVVYFKYGYLLFITKEHVPDVLEVFKRFAKVFEQTYTRFLDLQKAEAQAREAQIEAALERVRSASMGMHESSDLQNVIQTLFKQMDILEIPTDSAQISLNSKSSKDFNMWIYSPGEDYSELVNVPYIKNPIIDDYWKHLNQGPFSKHYNKTVKDEFFQFAFENSALRSVSEERKKRVLDAPGLDRATAGIGHVGISILNYQNIFYSDEVEAILARLLDVFNQAYTRFLDLQKAEIQTKEAQIEVSLERIRASSMAMHVSSELVKVVSQLHQELNSLGISVSYCQIITDFTNDPNDGFIINNATDKYLNKYYVPFLKHRATESLYKAFNNNVEYIEETYAEKDIKSYFELAWKYSDLKHMPEDRKKMILKAKNWNRASFISKNSALHFGRYDGDAFTQEESAVFKKMGMVFEQAYIRFLDLQKAEEQTRKAQIEAALERVRSRSLAMHNSKELLEVVNLLFSEFKGLGVATDIVGIRLRKDQSKDLHFWMGTADGLYDKVLHWPYENIKIFNEIHKAQLTGDVMSSSFSKKETKTFFKAYAQVKGVPEERIATVENNTEMEWLFSLLKNSGLFVMKYKDERFSDEEKAILKRFSQVFEQTYIRFQDLEKAEAQAREAQIERALEKVRSTSLAMHKSKDLQTVVNEVFSQMEALEMQVHSSAINIPFDNGAGMDTWFGNKEVDYSSSFKVIPGPYRILEDMFYAVNHPHELFVHQYEFEEKNRFFKYLLSLDDFKHIPEERRELMFKAPSYRTSLYFTDKVGMHINYFGDSNIIDADNQLLIRFTKVFEQAYVRFLDLQKAEAQAKEATKQASLDRVRAEIASMRHASDLERITPLVWNELSTLGVPFFRCGVMIVNEETETLDFYLSNPEGQALAALHLDFDNSTITKNGIDFWRRKQIYSEHWDQQQFLSFMKQLMSQGQITDINTYQGSDTPPKSLSLQFVPFAQGMVYVGSEDPLNEEQLELVEALGKSLSVAYARYEDFTKLDMAKAKAEKALSDLKSVQDQLIQSEKMASLGELTAGIAHEIQNPLNFVNNFSDVSKELLEEMLEEMEAGDLEEAKAIMDDVIQNLDKINHHGKRADSIVKGMLQHSRASGDKKEPTDLNKLADEYLRLAYHGLRAKDKSFNAELVTNFEENLPQVQVITQDIGRVILNLVTNAFYACQEKEKSSPADYKPTVKITTTYSPHEGAVLKGSEGTIQITVTDNGNGIPDHIKEKIFQPFFTTKPTGQGTGLGLSMSYDIITKGHGGELHAESEAGDGTTFRIMLPLNKNN